MSNITYVIKTLRSNIINVIKEEHYEKTITNINPWIDSTLPTLNKNCAPHA